MHSCVAGCHDDDRMIFVVVFSKKSLDTLREYDPDPDVGILSQKRRFCRIRSKANLYLIWIIKLNIPRAEDAVVGPEYHVDSLPALASVQVQAQRPSVSATVPEATVCATVHLHAW